jgi:hypothetical protein
MPPAVRITEVPCERRAERIQAGHCFTFFFKEKVDPEGFFLCLLVMLEKITDFIEYYTYRTVYLTDVSNV